MFEVEALVRMILPLEAIENHEAPDDEATLTSVFVSPATPWMVKLEPGVVEPTPTLPFCSIEKREVPVEDATLNGLVPALPCTLRVTVEEEALTPSTVPLSMSLDAVTVVVVSHLVANPRVPPDTPLATTPRDDVATHRVEVPVDWSTIPRVPLLAVESKSDPVRVRAVAEALPNDERDEKRLVADTPVVEALVMLASVE
jgi:hypothetical protein